MPAGFLWTCPYCSRNATILDSNYSHDYHHFEHNNKEGGLLLTTEVIVCPNSQCKEYTISACLFKSSSYNQLLGEWNRDKLLLQWNLKPQSQAKVFPSYIPAAILEDYKEACLIRDLSPKASATLSRRCLQGIIRDFYKITKSRLVDEIEALKGKIDPLVWNAIDAVRNIGNIGAHMEKDINLIIDVEPQEASALIGLIEMLLKDWYIDRYEKQQQLLKIVEISENKKKVKDKDEVEKKTDIPK
ncbi:MAG: DUF4145 domain-containing protein [Phycisphaerae bacterium]|nr:DUF4145 domain-containing protein [Phycisphaerae bacterium]